MSFTDREFRDALGQFATGVAIVTADVEGTLLGTTVSSFNSVSLAPPLVLFSLARTAFAHGLWVRARAFAVTILREDQSALSTRFARGGSDKWQGIDPERGLAGVPLLPGGLATFVCQAHAIHDGGDHDIMVGRVLSLTRGAGVPLLFHGGRYRALRPERQIETPPDTDFLLHGW